MNKAVAINGSPNKNGKTVEQLNKLGIPIYHLQDGIKQAYEAILLADVVVFATPTHYYNVSALMKKLIDEIDEINKEKHDENYPCQGKTAFFLAVCKEDGGQQAINQMFATFNHMGFAIPPFASYYYNINMPEKSEDQWMVGAMQELSSRLRMPPEQNRMGAFLCSSMLE